MKEALCVYCTIKYVYVGTVAWIIIVFRYDILACFLPEISRAYKQADMRYAYI
jgi:hypothetical protein